MEKLNKTVLGIFAPAARPDWRGFLLLAILLAIPVFLLLYGAEAMLRWMF